MNDYGVLDIENVDEPWNGTLICVGWRDRAYTVDDLYGEHAFVLDELADPDIVKVVFTKHDHRWLRLWGIPVNGPVHDVQAMAWAVDENLAPLDLDNVSRTYSNTATKDKRIKQRSGRPWFLCDDGTQVPLEEAPVDQVQAYNEGDLAATEGSYLGLLHRLKFEGLFDYWQDHVVPLTPTLLDLETRGVPVNVGAAADMEKRLAKEIAESDAELKEEAGLPSDFNLNSNDQLAAFLYTPKTRTFSFPRKARIDKETRERLKADPTDDAGLGFSVERVGRDYAYGHVELRGRGFKVHKHTDSGKRAVDSKTLKIHYGNDMWVQTYLDMAKRRTIVNTFLSTFGEVEHKGRIYGRFNQTGTVTGRLSSSGPNLQNIPSRGELGREVRGLFVPKPGWVFIHGDYGQLEPRLMAHFSRDPVLVDIFETGQDVYLRVAAEVFGEATSERRTVMKTYVLGLGYGAQPPTLRNTLAVEGFYFGLREVEDTFERMTKALSVLFEWREDVISDARKVGYVDTLSGHRRHILFGKAASRWTRGGDSGREGRQAGNAKVQGSAADVVNTTMVNLAAKFRGDPQVIVQVHDELLAEARRGVELRHPGLLAEIERIATVGHGFDLSIPLEFKPRVVPTWREGKD